MKNYYPLWSLLLLSFWSINLSAQAVFHEGIPYSFEFESTVKSDIPSKVMPIVNLAKLQEEDKLDKKGGLAPRFGFLHEVNYTLDNAGVWETLPNGDRLWRLEIEAPEALSININYSKFDLPSGGKLFIYSSPKKYTVLGPFTLDNEKSNGRFATGFTQGSACTIEYYEPKAATGKSQIEIDGIVHGYRTIPNPIADFEKAFQGSGSCNNDVACAIGAGWQDQIKSVGLHILANGTRWCSGALINNTGNDCKPYFLSANHCFNSNPGATLNDIFMFNYDSPTPACPGTPTSDGPTNQTVQGATVVANAAASDFYLLELTNNPLNFYNVYYSGWNRQNSGMTSSVGIHHPAGDVKKFSVDNNAPISDTYTGTTGSHWRVAAWDNGTTEPGSSGSPLFDQNKRIIGQLHGGTASCSQPNSPDYYGKVWYSWNQNGGGATQQLAPWLDPSGTGVMFIDGTDCSTPMPPVAAFNPANNSAYSFCSNGTISFNDLSGGNPTAWAWTFSGAGVSPTTSSTQNPTVTVTSTGTLTATLSVSNALGSDSQVQTYSITVSPCTTNNYCNTANVSIPDNNTAGVSNTFSVGPSGTIVDINIDVELSHTYVGDLMIDVSHGGTTVTLLGTTGCANDDINATFDDEGTVSANTVCNGGTAISGIVIPAQALSAFDGMNQTGNWTIKVVDNANQDTGTLDDWCLTISSSGGGTTCYSMLNNGNGLNSNETGVADYESSDWISTSGATTIQAGAKVDYDAANYIILNSGFQVNTNAIFNAFIDGCNNGAGGVNLRDENPNTQLKNKSSEKTEVDIIDSNKN